MNHLIIPVSPLSCADISCLNKPPQLERLVMSLKNYAIITRACLRCISGCVKAEGISIVLLEQGVGVGGWVMQSDLLRTIETDIKG